MASSSQAAVQGTGLPTLLLVAFVVLKLCGVIDWSWWWVLSPAWIPFVLVFAAAPVVILVFFCMEWRRMKRRAKYQRQV